MQPDAPLDVRARAISAGIDICRDTRGLIEIRVLRCFCLVYTQVGENKCKIIEFPLVSLSVCEQRKGIVSTCRQERFR